MTRTWRRNSMAMVQSLLVLVHVLFSVGGVFANKQGYYGKYIGKLSQLHHGVSGDVFAVDARTLHLRNFNYDGEGPAAYFYAGNSKAPGGNGFRLRDERGTTNVLPKYRNKHITITLPEGKTLHTIKWFSVWCDEFSVNFGDVKIPRNLDFPKPQKISGLSGVHSVSSEPIVIVDAQTLLVPSFSYDGEAPDAKFWVGAGHKPTPRGIRIPDENGKEVPLRRYDRKTIVLTLPGALTIFDIGHFGVWCEAFTVDFGHVQIPSGLNVPPSLKMLGVSPQSKLNCEVLWDDFAYEVRWAVAGDSIVLQLVARLESNEYMSFGLSGDKSSSRMVGGDVVVAWVDKESLKGYAEDYYLDAKSQCSGARGSCPDENIQEAAGSVRLLNAALVNGYSIVTFQRSLRAQDDFDGYFLTNGSQPVIWAIGPLNSRKEVSYHSLTNRGDVFIDFGRAPKWNCPTPESVADQSSPTSPEEVDESSSAGQSDEKRVTNDGKQGTEIRDVRPKNPTSAAEPTPAPASKSLIGRWEIPAIKCHEPEDGVFYAQMGPTGGKHGYSAITGHVGWGISWYINGLLIPEINVVRGRTYTFIVEGGLDPETPARYHPFYITDDPVGGYQYKTPGERLNIQIFAGAVQNKRGEVRPTGIGRLCNWTPDPNQPPADEFASFGAYQRTLRLECDPGNPGIIQWTVDKDTPDTVYYQCYTHRHLGWKINVHDHCESESASDPVPVIVKPPDGFQLDWIAGSESISHHVRVKPNFDGSVLANGTSGHVLGSSSNLLTRNFIHETGRGKGESGNPNSPQKMSKLQEEKRPYLLASSRPAGLSSYSVTESLSEDFEDLQKFQNFQIIPSAVETGPPLRSRPHQVKKEGQKVKQALHGHFSENPIGSSPLVWIQTEEKPKKQIGKPEHRGKAPWILTGSSHHLTLTQPKRKPSSTAAFPVHQKPVSPATSVGTALQQSVPSSPKVQTKRLTTYTQGTITATLNRPLGHGGMEGRPLKSAAAAAAIFDSPRQHQHQALQFAQNTGFDPESIKVESGFKPILSTARVVPSVVDRADVHNDGGNGETRLEEKADESSDEVVPKKMYHFVNQTPQTFEPIFVASFPDDGRIRKPQEKIMKKPVPGFQRGGEKPQKLKPSLVHVSSFSRPVSPKNSFRTRPAFPSRRSLALENCSEEHTECRVSRNRDTNHSSNAGNDKEDEVRGVGIASFEADEVAMADEQKDVYLAEEGGEFRTYDGKLIRTKGAPSLTMTGTFADISKLPQYVPFTGAIPPPSESVTSRNLPQAMESKLARKGILPPGEALPNVANAAVSIARLETRKKRSPDHEPSHHIHDHDHGHQDHDHDLDHEYRGKGVSKRANGRLTIGIALLAFAVPLCLLQ